MDTDGKKKKQEKKGKKEGRLRWTIQVFFISVVLSAMLTLASEGALDGAGLPVAFPQDRCRRSGYVEVVGDHHDRIALFMKAGEEF